MGNPNYNGWRWDEVNSELEVEVQGTKVLGSTSSALTITPATTVTGAATLSSTLTVTGLVTASAALTVTTGNLTTTAGDNRITAGNVRLGAVAAFGTTQPTSAVVCKQGTEGAGAVATSSGIWANATVLRKVIADGTVSNVG